eukprot:CAMPEP_0194775312 /NCGR_PEP_ID=MMETSP0323_2-20130528/60065_1 /TAXON_ID=2866 ORGANISM="Crypthecodinium cohnii, Strain Seligo" /NCGR_SAMPLE_ID=MMETSP0323_2 /ASSEMBLY_ACC=CAM_ASM_000346 /LENGTH=98 /DNA_ID=CAMNT_0039711241 /DNA_START=104 /DNA_END=400 /DNA_ORIENTATION=-
MCLGAGVDITFQVVAVAEAAAFQMHLQAAQQLQSATHSHPQVGTNASRLRGQLQKGRESTKFGSAAAAPMPRAQSIRKVPEQSPIARSSPVLWAHLSP